MESDKVKLQNGKWKKLNCGRPES